MVNLRTNPLHTNTRNLRLKKRRNLQETQIVLTQLTGCNFRDRSKLVKLCIRTASAPANVSHYVIKSFLHFGTKVRRIDAIMIKQAPGALRAN